MEVLQSSPEIYFGETALEYLRTLPEKLVLVVTDPFMVQSGMVKQVTDRLETDGRHCLIFSGVVPDPTVEVVADGLHMMFLHKPGAVVALGGGSAIDTAKAMLYFCMRFKESIMSGQFVHKLRFVAIPTTSGTGSEVTSYAVVSDPETGSKMALENPCMLPDTAILHAEFTKTLPRHIAAYTGMDVLTHAMEAYVSRNANLFAGMYAAEAVRKVLAYLPQVVAGNAPGQAYREMMVASTIAGMAFNNAGLGLAHGLAHTLGAHFHMPHGKANSIVLPYVVAWNAGIGRYKDETHKPVRARYAELAVHADVQENEDAQAAGWWVKQVLYLNRMFGIPTSLSADGIEKETFEKLVPEMAKQAEEDICTKANPVKIQNSEIQNLLWDVFTGCEIF